MLNVAGKNVFFVFVFFCNFGSSCEPEQQVYKGMSAGCIGKAVHLLNHQLLCLKTRQSVVEKYLQMKMVLVSGINSEPKVGIHVIHT